jgi:S1-C subfamily serine protease
MNSIGTELSRQLADAVERAGPAIVHIEGRRHLASSGILWSDGIVVTASHTLHRDEDIRVGDAEATLVGRDETTDVAVLRIAVLRIAVLRIGGTPGSGTGEREGAGGERGAATGIVWSDSVPRVGEIVIAAGRPGRGTRATVGFLTGVGGPWRTRDGGRIDAILEVDAHLPPGFSGGPLLAADGRALGMNTSGLVHGGTTIPHATLTRVVGELLEHGSIRRRHLGVGVYPVEEGLVVLSVQRGGPAEAAGVIVGDVLQTNAKDLRESLDVSQAFTLKLTRGGEAREVEVEAR